MSNRAGIVYLDSCLATQAGIKTHFVTAVDLMLQLAAAQLQGRYDIAMRHRELGPRLSIIDEIGFLPLTEDQASHFSHRLQTI